MEKPHRYLKCNYEDKCRYAHGQDELRSESSNPKYMPKPCRKYSVSGYCKCLLRCIFCMEKSRGKPNFVVISRKIRNAPTATSVGLPLAKNTIQMLDTANMVSDVRFYMEKKPELCNRYPHLSKLASKSLRN